MLIFLCLPSLNAVLTWYRWLGEEDAKVRLMKAVENVCEKGILTKDPGGTAMTKDVTKAVCEEIERLGGS